MKKTMLLLLAPILAVAEPVTRHTITMANGDVYENARITGESPIELVVISKGGAFTLKKAELSPADKVKFGYDSNAAEAESQKRAKEEEIYKQKRLEAEQAQKELVAKYASATYREFLVQEVRSDGVLLANFEVTADIPPAFAMPRTGAMSSGGMVGAPPPDMAQAYAAISYKKKGTLRFFVVNLPTTGLVDGAVVKGYFSDAGTKTYVDAHGINRTVPLYEYIGTGLNR